MGLEVLTPSQVAERWSTAKKQYSKRWVQNLIKRGKLQAEKVGGVYLVKVKDADSYEHQPGGRPSSNGHTSTVKRKRKTGNGSSPGKSRIKAGRKASHRAAK